LPRSTRLLLAGLATALLLGAGGTAVLLWKREAPRDGEQEFQELKSTLSSPDSYLAGQAAIAISSQKALLQHSERLREVAALFSGKNLLGLKGEERVRVARNFWRGIMLLGFPEGLQLVPPELGRLRHIYMKAAASEERPRDLLEEKEGQGGPRMRIYFRELNEDLFHSIALSREELGALVWDRANLEEMSGTPLKALETYQLLQYDLVRGHPEFSPGSDIYLLAKADLLGRILRQLPREKRDEVGFDFRSDPELEAFRLRDQGRMAHLLDGIKLFHQGELLGAVESLDSYLESGEGKPGILANPLQRFAALLRAMALRRAAWAAFQVGERIRINSSLLGASTRRTLQLKRARLLAALQLRDEFDSVRADFPPVDRDSQRLLSALEKAIWGEGEKGKENLLTVVSEMPDLPDASRWEELARGMVPPAPRALFEIGQLSDELDDLHMMERIISHLEYVIETQADDVYLAFLRAVLRLRRGGVVEAWADLDRLLNRPVYPPSLHRRDIARFMEGAEDASDLLSRARSLSQRAEKELALLHGLENLDRWLIHLTSMELWLALAEGELIDPARLAHRWEETSDFLAHLSLNLEKETLPSFAFDREWINLRNGLLRTYQELARSDRLDEALQRLAEFDGFLGAGAAVHLQGEEADLLRRRALAHESSGDQEGAFSDLRRAGDLYLKVAALAPSEGSAMAGGEDPQGDARREAALIFKRIGDLEGVVRALAPLEHYCEDSELLLRYGEALLGTGDLRRARDVLRRILAMGGRGDQEVEDPGEPVLLGGCRMESPPAQLIDWLEPHSYIDPINGIGEGRLRYNAALRTLEWRAPGDLQF